MLLLRKDAYAAPARFFPPAPDVLCLTRAKQLSQSRKHCGWGTVACYAASVAPLGSTDLYRGAGGGKLKHLVVIPFLRDRPSYPSARSLLKLMTAPVPPGSHCGICKM